MAIIFATPGVVTVTANKASISMNLICATEVITVTTLRAGIANVNGATEEIVITAGAAAINSSRRVTNTFIPDIKIYVNPAVIYADFITEDFLVGDSYQLTLYQLSTESFTVGSSVIESGIYANITETVVFEDIILVDLRTQFTDTVVFSDSFTFTHIGHLTESFTVSSSMTDFLELLVTENVAFNDVVISTVSSTNELVTSTVEFSDEVTRAELSISVTSSVVFTGDRAAIDTFESATSTVTFQDVVAAAWRVNTTEVTDTVRWAGDPIAAAATYTVSVTDTFYMSDAIWARDYTALAWVLNTETGGLSQYTNFGFDSLAEYNGVLYATSPEGIFEVNAETDNGRRIAARCKTGLLDFRIAEKKHLSSIYVGYTGGDLECSVETYNSGENSVYTYPIELRDAVAPRNTRVRIGKGLNSRYWRFTFDNVSGADFQIHDLTVDTGTSQRRL